MGRVAAHHLDFDCRPVFNGPPPTVEQARNGHAIDKSRHSTCRGT